MSTCRGENTLDPESLGGRYTGTMKGRLALTAKGRKEGPQRVSSARDALAYYCYLAIIVRPSVRRSAPPRGAAAGPSKMRARAPRVCARAPPNVLAAAQGTSVRRRSGDGETRRLAPPAVREGGMERRKEEGGRGEGRGGECMRPCPRVDGSQSQIFLARCSQGDWKRRRRMR